MRPNARRHAALLLTGLLATATPAAAEIVNGSFEGLVTYSLNGEAVFGVAGSMLGMTVTGTFSYDTALLPAIIYPSLTDATQSLWLGNASSGAVLAISETINGVTVNYGGTAYEALHIKNGGQLGGQLGQPAYQEISLNSYDSGPDGWLHVATIDASSASATPNFIGAPDNPAVSFSLSDIPVNFGGGQGSWDSLPNCGYVVNGVEVTGPGCQHWAFSITSMSANVPEPAPLAMLGAALLVLARAHRRRGVSITAS